MVNATLPRLALVGRLGSGKSHLSRELAGLTDGQVIAFGSKVYEVSELVLGRTIDKSRPEDRKTLVDIGTHWGRRGEPIDAELERALTKVWPLSRGYPDIWVDALDRNLRSSVRERILILDDLRFPNEARYLLKNNFHIMLVWCSDNTRAQRLRQRGDSYAAAVDSHESEGLATWLTSRRGAGGVVPSVWYDSGLEPNPCAHGLSSTAVLDLLMDPVLFEATQAQSTSTWNKLLDEYKCKS